ncbi:hypothetical protein [Asanoa sp. NPDC050611]|uniref:hypothetical protein n=1 Tax=Asanoa sp. NPDC050611 TaxID=3157098 RepID=UPI0034021596
METEWAHVGRLWTNGDPFLAIDSELRHLWRGFSDDAYFDQIVELPLDTQHVTLGDAVAAVVGADGVVRDDSWVEVFEAADGTIAVVQAAGDDYRRALDDALRYPDAGDDVGALIAVPSGQLAIFSAACDGAGEHSMALEPARRGNPPAEHGPPSREADPGLVLTTGVASYRLKIRWYTEIDDSSCFARWLLLPEPPA